MLLLVWNIVYSLRRGRLAGDNPWDAWTLEWATASPPPAAELHGAAAADPERPPALGPAPGASRRRRRRRQAGRGAPWTRRPSRPASSTGRRPRCSGCTPSSPPRASSSARLLAAFLVYRDAQRRRLRPARPRRPPDGAVQRGPVRQQRHDRAGRAAAAPRRPSRLPDLAAGDDRARRGLPRRAGHWSTSRCTARASRLGTNLFSSAFFTLTGFHGLHVLIGLLALAVVARLAFARRVPGRPPPRRGGVGRLVLALRGRGLGGRVLGGVHPGGADVSADEHGLEPRRRARPRPRAAARVADADHAGGRHRPARRSGC